MSPEEDEGLDPDLLDLAIGSTQENRMRLKNNISLPMIYMIAIFCLYTLCIFFFLSISLSLWVLRSLYTFRVPRNLERGGIFLYGGIV